MQSSARQTSTWAPFGNRIVKFSSIRTRISRRALSCPNFSSNNNFNLLTDHAFLKKWATLEKIGDDKKNVASGYLQVDLSIITTNEPPAPAVLQSFDDDVIEE